MSIDPRPRRTFLAQAGAALLSLPCGPAALARSPGDPLRMLCIGPGGSIPDIVARRAALEWTNQAAQPVIVDNRPGAAGQIAINALMSSPADGSTLLVAPGAIATVYPYLYRKLAYDPATDLQPVSLASEMTMALAVGPGVPATITTLGEFIAWLRANPKLASIGSPGIGTLPHLLEAMLLRAAGIPWEHVAYPGGPPAIVATLGGQIAALVLPEGLLQPHRAAGKLRILATSGSERTALLPDVATLAEQGYPDLVVREWFAFFMPGRTPPAIVESASKSLQAAIAAPSLVTAYADAGMTAASSTPAGLQARIAAEQRYWEPIVHSLGVRVE